MDIFISWSGQRSKACAEALNIWLPRVIQSVKPWIPTHGIAKGTRWSSDIAKQLDQHIYGIICVTPENRNSPWLNFEAGALSKTDSSRTFTLLVGLTHAEVEQPLAQFNHTLAKKDEVYALLQSVNSSCAIPLDLELLQHSFDTNWNFLENAFLEITEQPVPKEEEISASRKAQPRDDGSMIREILETVRNLTIRQQARPRPYLETRTQAERRELLQTRIRELSIMYPDVSFEWHQTQEAHGDLRVSVGKDGRIRHIIHLDTADPAELNLHKLERAALSILK